MRKGVERISRSVIDGVNDIIRRETGHSLDAYNMRLFLRKAIRHSKENRERVEKAMEGLVRDAELTRAFMRMNDGLAERFRQVYDDVILTKRELDVRLKEGGRRFVSYTVFPEYFFAEEGIKTADSYTLAEAADFMPWLELSDEFGDEDIPTFEEYLNGSPPPHLNWNIMFPMVPDLGDKYVHHFMYSMFHEGALCVADIPYLKPDDLEWQVTVQYEKFPDMGMKPSPNLWRRDR